MQDFVDATEEMKNDNIARMLHQLRSSKESALKDGVPEAALVYITRNNEDMEGSSWRHQSDAEDMLRETRVDLLPADGSTTYCCLVVDARDPENVTREVNSTEYLHDDEE